MKTRLNNHRQSIRNKRKYLPVSEHFAEKKHKESDLRFIILDHVKPLERGGDRLVLQKENELRLIFHLDTLKPKGLNVEFRVTGGTVG